MRTFINLSLCACLLVLGACATSQHQVMNSQMVSFKPKGYEKEGQFYKRRFFSKKGLMEVVKGNAKAEAYARKSKKAFNWATGLVSGGILSTVSGSIMMGDSDNLSTNQSKVGAVLYGLGAILTISASVQAYNSAVHEIDAVNAYNDDVMRALKLSWQNPNDEDLIQQGLSYGQSN